MTSDTKRDFFTAVEKSHGRDLRRFLAARMRYAAADVQDLAQEVYLRLLRIENHETIRNPRAYIYTVASHVLHQYTLRQSSQSDTVEIADVAAELQSAAEADPAIQLEAEQHLEEIGRRLQKHSPRAYAALIMQRRDGIPLKEIATRLGVSLSMTKRYLAQALEYCQQQLDNEE